MDCVQADKHRSCITAMPSCTIWHDGALLVVEHVSIYIWQNPEYRVLTSSLLLLHFHSLAAFSVKQTNITLQRLAAVCQQCLHLTLKGSRDTSACM